MQTTPAHTSANFRADLNGLRAVAVTLVILFHFKIGAFSGGFIGVDVFFVLSGFLMTGIIVSGLDKQKFRFLLFYANRAARILPALAAVGMACLAVGYKVLLPDQYTLLAQQTLQAVAFVINYGFAANTGYFDPAAADSWLLHCWSLAVEFQFYIVFPFYLWAAHRIKKRSGVLVALLIAIVVSAVCSLIQTMHSPTNAFYLLPSRAWEFAAGGLVVFAPRLPRHARTPLALAGLAIILSTSLMFTGALRYPSLWSAMPVAGAVLVIWAASSNAILCMGIAQVAGTTSYSLYLWHWPVLTIGRYLGYGGRPRDIAWMIAITFALATLSYAFVERPFRDMFRKRTFTRIVPAAVGAVAILLTSANVVRLAGISSRVPSNVMDVIQASVHKGEYRDGTCFLAPEQTFGDFNSDCFDPPGSRNAPTLAIWGDSHAAHLYHGIADQPWASKYRIIQLTASSCSPLPDVLNDARPNCPAIQRGSQAFILRLKPDVLILSASWRGVIADPHYVGHIPNAGTMTDLQDLIRSLYADGVKKIIVVGPIDRWPASLPQIFFEKAMLSRYGLPEELAITDASQYAAIDGAYRSGVEATGATYVSLHDALCKGNNCRVLVPNTPSDVLFQFDVEHLTGPGSDWLGAHAISPAMGEPVPSGNIAPLNAPMRFSDGASGVRYLVSGWMPPEGWGTWTAKPSQPGILSIPVDAHRAPRSVKIKFWGQLGPSLPKERFFITVDGGQPKELEVSQAMPVTEATFPLSDPERKYMLERGRLLITFLAPEGKSSKAMGLNQDDRVLGFGIREVTLLP